MTLLRTVVVIDYQNVHLMGHGLFAPHYATPRHETLVHPLHFANTLVQTRNQRQRPGHAHAELVRVLVYRGLPAEEHDSNGYRRNLMQKAHWERDRRVQVHLRPLKYDYAYDDAGRLATDTTGKRIVIGSPREKGIDVLCALAFVREARDPDVDVVILAAQDTDLVPALDEAIQLKAAKVETFSWYKPGHPGGQQQLRPSNPRQQIWNTRLDAAEFDRCRDDTDYS